MSLAPLNIKTKLRSANGSAPKYAAKVKKSDGSEAICGDPAYTRALVALMDLGAVNGGAACHWGGPAAAAEMNSAIHSIMFEEKNWTEKYNFVNDIGHAENGIYALRANLGYGDLTLEDLKGFRSIESKLTGHGESHLYPEGVLLSNGPLSSALPQAQGLAMADKLAGNKRSTICMLSDGASMEGEAKEAFAAIPGLAAKGKLNPFIMVISDNNTKLSGRIGEDSFDMTPTFASMETLGWKVIKVENGNDLQACYSAFEKAQDLSSDGPVFIWLKTVKGHGVKSTEESASGGHGFPIKAYSSDIHSFLSEILSGEVPSELESWANELTKKPESKNDSSDASVKKEKVQAGLARGAVNMAKKGLPVVSVSSDLQGSTGMAAFHKEFPGSSFDVGIAEANMVSVAAGMSKAGYLPIVDTFAAFGITKGNLPLIMASLSEAPVIAVFSHTGFQDAADGASHQSLTYISAVSSVPHLKVIVPASSNEAETLMEEAIAEMKSDKESGKTPSSYVFFVGRENFPADLGQSSKLGKAQVLKNAKDGLIVACGPMVSKALEASEELAKNGKEVGVINLHAVNTPDLATIKQELASSKKLITIEDHQLVGGMGAQLFHALKQDGAEFSGKSLGVKGVFGQSAYTADELYDKNGLNAQGIIKAFNAL